MNEFKQAVVQIWESLPTGRKASLIASMLLCFAILGGVIYMASKPKLTLLYGGLSSTEASKIVDHLRSKKISYELGDGGGTILIPANQVYETRLALASQGIPSTSEISGGVGFELLDRPSFGVSDFIQKANYYRALQGELAKTIKQMDEIRDARVLIVAPEEQFFAKKKREAKASVFIQTKPGRSLSSEQVQAIRFLVASGVENLDAGRVVVVDGSGQALAADDNSESPGYQGSKQYSFTREVEENLREKAQSMLDQVLGPGQSTVRITAELNFNSAQQTSEQFDPKSTVVRSENIQNETNSSHTETNPKTAGASNVTNQPAESTNPSGPATTSEQRRENTSNQYEINKVVESKQIPGGEINRLTVAVFINTKKTEAVGGAKATPTPRTPQELKSLEEIVKAAVGFSNTGNRKDSIQLCEVAFADMFADKAEEPSSDISSQVTRWLPYATQGLLVCLAAAIFFYMSNVIKGAGRQLPSDGQSFSDLIMQYQNAESAYTENSQSQNGHGRMTSLSVDEMSKLIRDNPSNTAQAIKQWVHRN